MTGGQALVRALVRHGVDTVFGIPGTHNLDAYAALAEHGVRHVGTRHEQGAGYAADGYARATGRPGVALVTSGPATLNAAAAIGQAYSDSVPVLLVSPGLPLRHPGRGNGFLHETKDQSRAMDAVAAYSHRVTSVAEIPVAVAQAFAAMTSGRPRPVHLEIPLDVMAEDGYAPDVAPLPIAVTRPCAAELDAAAGRLASATHPVIIAGGGARRANVRAMAERLGAPVVTTANGRDEAHPLSLGAGLHLPAVRDLVEEADVVLVVGSELAPSDLWAGPLPLDGKVIRVDVDPAQIITNAVPAIALVGDAATILDNLLVRLTPAAPGAPSGPGATTAQNAPAARGAQAVREDGRERAARWRGRKDAQAEQEGARWLWIVRAIERAVGPGGMVAGDSTMACYYGALANTAGRLLYPTGYGTLGYGLPAAIGAAVGRPELRVAALMGDGGVMFTVAELACAVQLGLPLPVVVVDNGGYGEIGAEMAARKDPVHAVELPSPDFPMLARALGAHGVRADDSEALRTALERAFEADRPTLIQVKEPR